MTYAVAVYDFKPTDANQVRLHSLKFGVADFTIEGRRVCVFLCVVFAFIVIHQSSSLSLSMK